MTYIFLLDLHLHLFACLGGHFRLANSQNLHAVPAPSRSSLRCGHRLHPNSYLHRTSQLAMGVLHAGSDCDSASVTCANHDQRQVLRYREGDRKKGDD